MVQLMQTVNGFFLGLGLILAAVAMKAAFGWGFCQ